MGHGRRNFGNLNGLGMGRIPGVENMVATPALPSPQAAMELNVMSYHHREIPCSRPAVVPIHTTDGPLIRLIGGYTKLEEGALIIGANSEFTPEEAVQRAVDILELCRQRQDANEAEREKQADAASEIPEQRPSLVL